jgi:iron complex transport system permease protein
MPRPNKTKLIIAALVSLFFISASVSLGSSGIPIGETLKVLFNKLFFEYFKDVDRKIITIIWDIRFPRAILAFLVGGALSVSGAVVQSILKNQLASPYILGVSSGASLGAGLVMLSAFTLPLVEGFTLPLAGFVFGLATVFFVVAFSTRLDKTLSNNTVILFGMVFSLFINALLTMLIALYREELKSLIIWQMGSFAMRGWSSVKLLIPFMLIGTLGVMRFTKEMDILTFGDEHAASAGVETKNIKSALLLLSTVLTGSAVALSGTIGFVDLISPHVSRRIVGSKHKALLPMSFFVGGTICIAADLIARTIVSPSELPVGAITALVGAPFFTYMYFKKR